MAITKEQRTALIRVDRSGVIQDGDKELLPGVHFCCEWDGMAICKGVSEWECCTCKIKREIESNGQS